MKWKNFFKFLHLLYFCRVVNVVVGFVVVVGGGGGGGVVVVELC